jgi:HSP20 family molecular chaperone IbpA
LHVAAERSDDHRNQRPTFRRSFRLPKEVDDAITAQYPNGVLEITLPTVEGATTRGKPTPVEG